MQPNYINLKANRKVTRKSRRDFKRSVWQRAAKHLDLIKRRTSWKINKNMLIKLHSEWCTRMHFAIILVIYLQCRWLAGCRRHYGQYTRNFSVLPFFSPLITREVRNFSSGYFACFFHYILVKFDKLYVIDIVLVY